MTPDQREVIRQHVAGNESIGPIVGALLDEIDRLEAERDQWSANHGKLAGQFLDLKAEHKLEIALLMASRSTPGLGALARDLTKLDLKDAQEQHDLDVAEWAKERRRLEAKVMDLTYQAKCGHSSWPVCDCGYKHPGCGGSQRVRGDWIAQAFVLMKVLRTQKTTVGNEQLLNDLIERGGELV